MRSHTRQRSSPSNRLRNTLMGSPTLVPAPARGSRPVRQIGSTSDGRQVLSKNAWSGL
jgi:hypothetical protein